MIVHRTTVLESRRKKIFSLDGGGLVGVDGALASGILRKINGHSTPVEPIYPVAALYERRFCRFV